jgi:cytochrome c-550 PedF
MKLSSRLLTGAGLLLCVTVAAAHGDMVPQAVDTAALPKLGAKPLSANPYRDDAKIKAIATGVGASAYTQNCARCHGLGAVSGGIAPDLRHLPPGKDGDDYYAMRVRNGVVRNGVTYMPSFKGVFDEEAIWAVRTYLDQVHVDD